MSNMAASLKINILCLGTLGMYNMCIYAFAHVYMDWMLQCQTKQANIWLFMVVHNDWPVLKQNEKFAAEPFR